MAEGALRFVQAVKVEEAPAEAIEGFVIIGVQFDGTLEDADRFIVAFLVLQHPAEATGRKGEVGSDRQGAAVARFCIAVEGGLGGAIIGEEALELIGAGEPCVVVGTARVELDCSLEVADRRVVLVVVEGDATLGVLGIGVVWINLQCCIKGIFGLVVLVLAVVAPTDPDLGIGVVGVNVEGGLEGIACARVVFAMVVEVAEIALEEGDIGHQIYCLLVVLFTCIEADAILGQAVVL